MYERAPHPDEIYHSFWGSHKYIKKIRSGNGWRYIYDTASKIGSGAQGLMRGAQRRVKYAINRYKNRNAAHNQVNSKNYYEKHRGYRDNIVKSVSRNGQPDRNGNIKLWNVTYNQGKVSSPYQRKRRKNASKAKYDSRYANYQAARARSINNKRNEPHRRSYNRRLWDHPYYRDTFASTSADHNYNFGKKRTARRKRR